MSSFEFSFRPSDQSASKLLQLPRELRDIIYKQILDPGSTPSEVVREKFECQGTERVRVFRGLWYLSSYQKYTLLSTVQTCRLLRAEVLDFFESDFIKAEDGGPQTLQLEVVATKDSLVPTWTRLPLPPCFFQTIKCITIDIFAVRWHDEAPIGWAGNIGPSLGILSSFYRLLSDLLHHGPQFYYEEQLANKRMPLIEKIRIRFSTWQKFPEGIVCSDTNIETRTQLDYRIQALILSGSLVGQVGAVSLQVDETELFTTKAKETEPMGLAKHITNELKTWEVKWGVNENAKLKGICQCQEGNWEPKHIHRPLDETITGTYSAGHLHPLGAYFDDRLLFNTLGVPTNPHDRGRLSRFFG